MKKLSRPVFFVVLLGLVSLCADMTYEGARSITGPFLGTLGASGAVVPAERRGTGFGVFHTGYGLAWFIGSALMGWLYDRSVLALVTFSVLAQVAAMVVFTALARGHNRHLH